MNYWVCLLPKLVTSRKNNHNRSDLKLKISFKRKAEMNPRTGVGALQRERVTRMSRRDETSVEAECTAAVRAEGWDAAVCGSWRTWGPHSVTGKTIHKKHLDITQEIMMTVHIYECSPPIWHLVSPVHASLHYLYQLCDHNTVLEGGD